jgi:glycosyltransferase involved in cell wall biosynthesis
MYVVDTSILSITLTGLDLAAPKWYNGLRRSNMRISYNTLPGNLSIMNGFGHAGFDIVRSLQALGHEVPYQDPTAPVELNFCQPQWMDFSSLDQYHIGYTPWESTVLPENWVEDFNECDEVWTPSRWTAGIYENHGVKKPVRVFPHGINPEYSPRLRDPGIINFFHQGEPAPRKGGQLVLDCFRAAFGDRSDVHLTIKSHGWNSTRAFNDQPGRELGTKGESIKGAPDKVYNNVSVITRDYPEEDMPGLYHDMDVMVYPSWGEGFGLIPHQAIATGMPTIVTNAWVTYEELILDELKLHSQLTKSPWQNIHPGKMFKPDADQLIEILRWIPLNYTDLAARAYQKAKLCHKRYNWLKLTETAFEEVVKKFG